MKRTLLISLMLLMFVGAVSAQGIVDVGPKVGLNFASWGGDNSTYFTSTTKFFFGGFMEYDFIKNFGLQGELLYNTAGTGVSVQGQTGTISISYLEIVALAKYNIPVDKAVKIFFVAGPQLGIKLSANAHQDANSTDTDYGQYISGSDFDIVVGTGTSFKVGPGNIIVDLRYNIGLSNVQKTSPPSNSNQVFSLGVGYGFSLK
jgi:Outer membrane protein beta-barrel domain